MHPHRIARSSLIGLELFLGATATFGAVLVVPALPTEWLEGTPFTSYAIPAFALGTVGISAFLAAAALLFRWQGGRELSFLVGAGITIFEVVETMVVGLDYWLHLLGLRPTPGEGLPGQDLQGLPILLGVPLPLWLQPLFFIVGLTIMALALRLRAAPARRTLRPRVVRA